MEVALVSKECIESRSSIANSVGLVLVGNPTNEHKDNPRYHTYRFETCGHAQNIDASLVKAKKYKCRQCEDSRLHKDADNRGLELIDRAHLEIPPLYRFKECGHTQHISYTSIRRGTYKCQSCYYKGESLNEKYTREAEGKGVRFVRLSNIKSCGVYECKDGHLFDYQISAVRASNNVNCPVCKKNKLISDADKVGLIIKSFDIVRSSGIDHRTYTFSACGHDTTISSFGITKQDTVVCSVCKNLDEIEQALNRGATLIKRDKHIGVYKLECGHIKRMIPSTMKVGGFRCTECYEDNLKKLGADFGYEYIGKSVKGSHYRLFNRVSCGHKRDLQVHDLTGRVRNEMVCRECISEAHKTEAEEAGLKLVGLSSTKNPNKRKYIADCCNTSVDLLIVQVRRNIWSCPGCGANHYSDPSSLYLLKINLQGETWLKLGMAKDIPARIKGYGLHTDAIVDILETKDMDTGYLAIALEKALHRKFKDYRLDPNEMRVYHQSGFTECYPLNMLETLTKELNGN